MEALLEEMRQRQIVARALYAVERTVEELRCRSVEITDEHLRHLSPLGWEHISLTGVYRWGPEGTLNGLLRPLRS